MDILRHTSEAEMIGLEEWEDEVHRRLGEGLRKMGELDE